MVGLRQNARRAECIHPVPVPQLGQDPVLQRGLEVAHVEGVVALAVHAKVLDLVHRDALVLGRTFLRATVPLWVCPEGTEVDCNPMKSTVLEQ